MSRASCRIVDALSGGYDPANQLEAVVTVRHLGVAALSFVLVSACVALPASSPSAPAQSATPAATTEAPSPATLPPTAVAPATAPSSNATPVAPPPSAEPPSTELPVAPPPSAEPPSTEPPVGWSVQRVLRDQRYSDLSMAMDSGGAIHAAAVVNAGIVYLTNVTGTWVQMPLSAPLEEDEVAGAPSIGVDAAGRMAVAFHRGKCGFMSCTPFQVFLVTNDSGEWSEERPIAGGDSPSLQLRNGVIHLTYKVSEGSSDVACPRPVPIRYKTNAGGDWQDMPVSTHGDEAILEMGSDGLPRVMLGNYCGFLGDKGIYYATTQSSTDPFVLEPIPGATPDDYGLVDMALGPQNRPQAIYWHFTESDSRNLYLALDDGEWTSAELVAPSLNVVSIATDPDGAANLVAQGDTGTWYMTNRDGSFSSQQVKDVVTAWSNAADIVVDPSGRPHLLFAVGGYDAVKPGLFYAIGPSQ